MPTWYNMTPHIYRYYFFTRDKSSYRSFFNFLGLQKGVRFWCQNLFFISISNSDHYFHC